VWSPFPLYLSASATPHSLSPPSRPCTSGSSSTFGRWSYPLCHRRAASRLNLVAHSPMPSTPRASHSFVPPPPTLSLRSPFRHGRVASGPSHADRAPHCSFVLSSPFKCRRRPSALSFSLLQAPPPHPSPQAAPPRTLAAAIELRATSTPSWSMKKCRGEIIVLCSFTLCHSRVEPKALGLLPLARRRVLAADHGCRHWGLLYR
jgi:hypothetical protein